MLKQNIYTPTWPLLPPNVKAIITTRSAICEVVRGGDANNIVLKDDFNLALHVNDDTYKVLNNRQILDDILGSKVHYLNQTHSNKCIELHEPLPEDLNYDAAFTIKHKVPCAVMTADCIPILLSSNDGSMVLAIHAGWRGVLNGIIQNTINQALSKTSFTGQNLTAFIGPGICSKHFIVKQDVYSLFQALNSKYLMHFTQLDNIHYSCDLFKIVHVMLCECNLEVANIFVSNYCTICNNDLFYSYRKEGQTGRFVSLIMRA